MYLWPASHIYYVKFIYSFVVKYNSMASHLRFPVVAQVSSTLVRIQLLGRRHME